MWELPELSAVYHGSFTYLDEVWVGSNYCLEAISSVSPVLVVKIPLALPVDGLRTKGVDRSYCGLPDGPSTFLFVFDVHSVLARKNPSGLIEAFKARIPQGRGRAAGPQDGARRPGNPPSTAGSGRRSTGPPHRSGPRPAGAQLAHRNERLLRVAPPVGGVRGHDGRGDGPRQAGHRHRLLGQPGLHDQRQQLPRPLRAGSPGARSRPVSRRQQLGRTRPGARRRAHADGPRGARGGPRCRAAQAQPRVGSGKHTCGSKPGWRICIAT
jgi:hypothetical protein